MCARGLSRRLRRRRFVPSRPPRCWGAGARGVRLRGRHQSHERPKWRLPVREALEEHRDLPGACDLRQPRARIRLCRGGARPLERARADGGRGGRGRRRGRRRARGRRDEPRGQGVRPSRRPGGKRFRFTNRIPLERGLGSSAAAIALGLAAARPEAERRRSSRPASSSRATPTTSLPRSWAASRSHGRAASRVSRTRSRLPRLRSCPASGRRPRPRAARSRPRCRTPTPRRAPPAPRSSARARPRGDAALFAAGARRLAPRALPALRRARGGEGRPPARRPRRHAFGLRPDGDRLGRRPRRLRGGARDPVPRARRARARRLAARRAVSVRLVDCRPRDAYEAGHVPGAVHLDPETQLSATAARPVGRRAPSASRPARPRRGLRRRRDRAGHVRRSRTTRARAGPRAAGGSSAISGTTRRGRSTLAPTPDRSRPRSSASSGRPSSRTSATTT